MINKHIYKYFSEEKFIIDVLRHKRLYFCKPAEFNDPFDCRPPISIKYCKCTDDDVWKEFLYYSFYTKYCYIKSENEIRKIANDAFVTGFHKDPQQLRIVDEHLRKIGSLVRVCCFAKDEKNTMMWAHYANNHQGLVFEFCTDNLRDKSGEVRGYDVKYSNKKVELKDYVQALKEEIEGKKHLEIAKIYYATKSEYWGKEDEVRFFSEANQAYVEFLETALSSIIFGSDCSMWLIQQIIDELKHWTNKPDIYQADINNSINELSINSI